MNLVDCARPSLCIKGKCSNNAPGVVIGVGFVSNNHHRKGSTTGKNTGHYYMKIKKTGEMTYTNSKKILITILRLEL